MLRFQVYFVTCKKNKFISCWRLNRIELFLFKSYVEWVIVFVFWFCYSLLLFHAYFTRFKQLPLHAGTSLWGMRATNPSPWLPYSCKYKSKISYPKFIKVTVSWFEFDTGLNAFYWWLKLITCQIDWVDDGGDTFRIRLVTYQPWNYCELWGMNVLSFLW